MSGVTDPDILASEVAIVWLCDPEAYDYLREASSPFVSPTARPTGMLGRGSRLRLMAYAKVRRRPRSEDSPHLYRRRFWYLHYDDDHLLDVGHFTRDPDEAPSEAVVPLSVEAGVVSREWGDGPVPGSMPWLTHPGIVSP
jgi:hypothetical protein